MRKNVVIVGNCQASAVANVYRDFVGNPNFEAVTYFNDHDVPLEETRQAVADADLIIVQDRDFNHGLQPEQLQPGIVVQPFPMVLAGFVWPFADEPHVYNVPEPPFSDGPYPSQLSDGFLNRLIRKGESPEDALDQYLGLDIARATHIDRLMEIYFNRQQERDARSGFHLAPTIQKSFRDQALFRTPHHPNTMLFGLVIEQLFERLDVPQSVIKAAQQSLHTSPFPLDELPIHPGVIQHFGLTFADGDTRYSYFDEGRFTFREYVLRYMRYENNHALRAGIFQADHGAPDEALALLDRGLDQSPDSVRGWRARGIALDRLGRHEEACTSFARATEADPYNPEGPIALSISLRAHGDFGEALSAAERAVATAPNYASAHRVLSEARIALRDPTAADAATAAVRLLPSGGNLHLLGLATMVAGRLEEAERSAARLVAMEPQSPDARNLLAEVLEEAARRPEAISILEDGLANGVANAQTFSLLGNFHLRNSDLIAAEATFDRGVGLDPERTDLEQCRDEMRVRIQARATGASGNEVGAYAEPPTPPLPVFPASGPAPMAGAEASPTKDSNGQLYWLPHVGDWRTRIADIERRGEPDAGAWEALVSLAKGQLDFVRTGRLDKSLIRLFGAEPPAGLVTAPIRLALLGSSTTDHLLPAIRVAALRRGLWLTAYQPEYGQYRQDLLDPSSPLYTFGPNVVLFAQDARHLLAAADVGMDAPAANAVVDMIIDDLTGLWTKARRAFRAQVIQQTPLPVFPALMGSNEFRLPGSAAALASSLSARLAGQADAAGLDLLAMDRQVAQNGVSAWYDPTLWHRAKQEITPLATPLYGDLVARLLAAGQGRSAKCLVLDLDNTLWGGVLGDDGIDGIALGQGSALGEAFAGFQSYAKALTHRGVLLAVCSKNDEANALAAFETHSEMVLKRSDISAFVANWDDKATNLRRIARTLNIGLDSLVFADDNPFERNLVRSALPEVTVPELPDDPALYSACISDAGYFESLALTSEDRTRTEQYKAQRAREAVAGDGTDLVAYLRSLDMRLTWGRFGSGNLKRVTQLINKTNQFNLTNRRYTEEDVAAIATDSRALGLHFRLVDRFGDNGIIAVVIGWLDSENRLDLAAWLMSCRVLGRGVEQATLGVILDEARRLDATAVVGRFRPSAKNQIVAEHYPRLGFQRIAPETEGEERYLLESRNASTHEVSIMIAREDND